METDSRNFPRGGIRVSDADRDRAVTELSEHFQSGRLTQDEFEERSGSALRARTGEDLSGLFGDLPQRPVAPLPPAGGSPVADGLVNRPPRSARRPVARLVIGMIIALIIVGNLTGGNVGRGHPHGFSWLIPVVILGLIFVRLGRRH